jgi:hypothetical protein
MAMERSFGRVLRERQSVGLTDRDENAIERSNNRKRSIGINSQWSDNTSSTPETVSLVTQPSKYARSRRKTERIAGEEKVQQNSAK